MSTGEAIVSSMKVQSKGWQLQGSSHELTIQAESVNSLGNTQLHLRIASIGRRFGLMLAGTLDASEAASNGHRHRAWLLVSLPAVASIERDGVLHPQGSLAGSGVRVHSIGAMRGAIEVAAVALAQLGQLLLWEPVVGHVSLAPAQELGLLCLCIVPGDESARHAFIKMMSGEA